MILNIIKDSKNVGENIKYFLYSAFKSEILFKINLNNAIQLFNKH